MAVEKRIQSFVLMANTYSLHDFVYDDQNPALVEWRKSMGDEKIQAYFRQFPWDDSKPFAGHSAPAAVFLQNGRLDSDLPEQTVRKSFQYFLEPKRIEFYDAGHELNSAARVDRVKWLQTRLKVKTLKPRVLGAIKQVK